MDEGVTIRDVMTREFLGVSESDTIGDIVEMVLKEDVGAVVVVRGSDPVGLVTDRDLLTSIVLNGEAKSTPVREIMLDPGPILTPDLPVSEAINLLTSEGIDHLVVSNDGGLIGIITASDFILTAASFLLNDELGEEMIYGETIDRPNSPTMDSYSTQSVCEVCGAFAPDLNNINGQLVCADCRSV